MLSAFAEKVQAPDLIPHKQVNEVESDRSFRRVLSRWSNTVRGFTKHSGNRVIQKNFPFDNRKMIW